MFKAPRIAQLNLHVGDIAGNASRIISAANSGSGLIVFPEMAITGYSSEDLWLSEGYLKKEQAALRKITKAVKQPVILGATHSKDGKVYNAAYYIENGKAEVVAFKKNLPNNGVFDENRWFSPDGFYKFLPGNVAVLVCEDIWHKSRIDEVISAGAKAIISINASPYEWGKKERRHKIAHDAGLPFVYVNCIAGQDEVIFDGSSFYFDGDIIRSAPSFEEFVGEITEVQPNLTKEESNYKAICLGLKDYVQKNGFKRVLLGVSGGIDSAIVAAIAVDSLGKENVRGIILPTKYSSKITMEDAYGVCEALEIEHEEHEVWDHYKQEQGLTAENMQSRIRGVMLMALSNKHNELLLTTGNKSEIATGYCTIYGDMNGAYNPIKDLYKTEVYEVVKYYNSLGRGGLPERVLTKAPTAELRENQTDQDSLPPYDVLDGILRQLIEGHKQPEDVTGYDEATIRKVAKLVKISEFKRRQSAPGPKLTTTSFGKDWRMPLSNKNT